MFLNLLLNSAPVQSTANSQFVKNYTKQTAKAYKEVGNQGTYYLGRRDIPFLLQKYVTGKKVIDYGCGIGFVTRLLQKLGYNVVGVDNSAYMLTQALKEDQESHFIFIKSGKLPFLNSSYDCCICSFVLFSVSTKKELISICKEIFRCLKNNGIFIVITANEGLYNHEWISYDTNFEENKKLTSGALAKIKLKEENLTFTDYYWMNQDYLEVFNSSGFHLVEKLLPLGQPEDNEPWISEKHHAPFAIYVLQKKTSTNKNAE